MNHSPRAFVLLYIVLMVSSILTALVLAAGASGSFAGGRLRLDQQGDAARMIAEDCGEQLLMQVRNATTTSGAGSLSIGSGTCTYSISGNILPKTVTFTAVSGTLYKRMTISLSQLDPTLTALWNESS